MMRTKVEMIFLLWLAPLMLVGHGIQEANKKQETICRFRVKVGVHDRIDPVASVLLDGITVVHDSLLTLYDVTAGGMANKEFQVEITGGRRFMHWMIERRVSKGSERQYLLVKSSAAKIARAQAVRIDRSGGDCVFGMDGRDVLVYRAGRVEPPAGVDSAYRRSGFINPLYAPNGVVLTRVPDADDDHLHHYGLWNAWKKVVFRDEEIDFFAPQFGQGTVRHVGISAVEEGPVYARMEALREHITWQGTQREAVAMKDLMDVRVYKNERERFVIDIGYRYNPIEPFLIKAYRYAGFSFRATDGWTNDNSGILTSEGYTRDEADGKGSRWCRVTGETQEGMVTMLFMSHPANYNHPEPMRIWPSRMNDGIGHVYINYNPVRNTDWLLLPGSTYRLQYRLLIVNGALGVDEAELAWQDFADPLKVEIITE